MKTNKLARCVVLSLTLGMFLAGCTTYYKINDPAGGRNYYTTNYKQNRDGSVTFVDEKSTAKLTLQSSEVLEIDKEAYEQALAVPAANDDDDNDSDE